MQERLGVTTAQVAVAYAAVRSILDLDSQWADCLARPVGENQRVQALLEIRELVEHLTSWLLRTRRDGSEVQIDRFARSVRMLIEQTSTGV